MAGFVPAIHVFGSARLKTWMRAMGCPVERGHDESEIGAADITARFAAQPFAALHSSYLLRFTRAVCRAAALRCCFTALRLLPFFRAAADFLRAGASFFGAAAFLAGRKPPTAFLILPRV